MQNLQEFIRVATRIDSTLNPNTNSPELTAALKVIISLYKSVSKLLFRASPDQNPISRESTIRVATPIIVKQG